jgi:hypothetical protein
MRPPGAPAPDVSFRAPGGPGRALLWRRLTRRREPSAMNLGNWRCSSVSALLRIAGSAFRMAGTPTDAASRGASPASVPGVEFSRELRNDVLAGDITLSVRLWKRPQVKQGPVYAALLPRRHRHRSDRLSLPDRARAAASPRVPPGRQSDSGSRGRDFAFARVRCPLKRLQRATNDAAAGHTFARSRHRRLERRRRGPAPAHRSSRRPRASRGRSACPLPGYGDCRRR